MALRQLITCVTLSASPMTVTHARRKCLAQLSVAEAGYCTSRRTAADAGCEPRGIGPARRNRGVSARGRSQDRPLVGLRSGKILMLRGWARRCPRRQGYICLPLKLCRARAEDPCGEGGNPTIRLRQSKPVEELRHLNRCDAVERVRIEPSGPQALPDPKLACDRECRERGQISSGNPTLFRQLDARKSVVIQGEAAVVRYR
jgi:hypothetical protein